MSIIPPRPRGPHLNALRAFEAAARLGSFTSAAEELGVSPGAIAQHIKALEEWARAPLFARNARGVSVTRLAESLLPDFSAAFDQLGEAVHRLRSEASPLAVNIAALPAIAQLWLPEKLSALRILAPDLSVSVTALEVRPNLSRGQFDLALFYAEGPVLEDEIEIQADRIFPVCTPEISGRLVSPADLRNETLLLDAVWADDWALWLGAAGERPGAMKKAQTYSLFSVALEEARRGAGVLISHAALVETTLRSGELVQPFDLVLEQDRSLRLQVTRSFSETEIYEVVKEVLLQT